MTADNVVTILRALDGHRACKRFYIGEDGKPATEIAPPIKWWTVDQREVGSIGDLALLLAKVEQVPEACIIRGDPCTETNRQRTRRLANDQEDGAKAAFKPARRSWMMLDFDAVPCPAGVDPATDPEGAVEHVIGLLPPEFWDASCWWQFSSSQEAAGETLKLHLWFMLKRAVSDGKLKRWAQAVNDDVGSKLIDPALFNCVQEHFTARPMFDGVPDPLPRRSGLRLGLHDAVELFPKTLPPKAGERLSVEAALAKIGGPDGFNDPLYKAALTYFSIGGTDEAEITGKLQAAVRAADPGGRSPKEISRYASDKHLSTVVKWARGRARKQSVEASGVGLVLYPHDPVPSGEAFLAARAGKPLRAWRGDFYEHDGISWRTVEAAEVTKQLYRFLNEAVTFKKGEGVVRFAPNRDSVGKVQHALLHQLSLPSLLEPGQWVEQDDDDPPAEHLVLCANGLLNVETGEMLDQEDCLRFFGVNALAVSYDAEATAPEWEKFKATLWPDDPDSQNLLDEIIGYCLTPDTSQQKIFPMIGPRRCGKGTIGRLIESLLGKANVAGSKLGQLGERFGLQKLVGKLVCIVGDARLHRKDDKPAVVDALLSVSGEDKQSVERKNTTDWEGTLRARIIILGNKVPELGDESGALPGRYNPLLMKKSFYGMEDLTLGAKLNGELAGILNAALRGRKRLRNQGAFTMPDASTALNQVARDHAQPMQLFIEECCTIGADLMVDCNDFRRAYNVWREQRGMKTLSATAIGSDLLEAVPTRTRGEHDYRNHYFGLALATVVSGEDAAQVLSEQLAGVSRVDEAPFDF